MPRSKRQVLCYVCEDLHLDSFESLRSSTRAALGSVGDVLGRKPHCAFCRLLIVFLEPFLHNFSLALDLAPLSLELKPPRHLAILVYDEKWLELELGKATYAVRPPFVDSISAVLNARSFSPSKVQHWLKECEASHECGKFDDSRGALPEASANDIHIRLIDVRDMKIIPADTKFRYFALSYVWGDVSAVQLTKATIRNLSEDGALKIFDHQIPQVIRDTMEMTRNVDERYLWVDSLCIIQDDKTQKHEQILQMDQIYSRALATFAAVSAQNADGSTFSMDDSKSKFNALLNDIDTIQRQKNVDFCEILLFHAMPLSFILRHSEYESRAWTFQERLLSRRIVYLTDFQTYFECQSGVTSQLSHTSSWFPRNNPFWLGHTRQGEAADFSHIQSTYATLVETYTRKRLTFESDILNAFSGVLDALQRFEPGGKISTYVCGLPTFPLENSSTLRIARNEHLIAGGAEFGQLLLWRPLERLRRREVREVEEDILCGITPFPSWSWAGWVGRVTYSVEFPPPVEQSEYYSNYEFAIGSLDSTTMAGKPLETPETSEWKIVQVEHISGVDSDILTPSMIRRNDFYTIRVAASIIPAESFEFHPFRDYSDSSDVVPISKMYDSSGKGCGIIWESFEHLPYLIPGNFFLMKVIQRKERGFLGKEDNPIWSIFKREKIATRYSWVDVMLIRFLSTGLAERIAIGQMATSSWTTAAPVKKDIYLG